MKVQQIPANHEEAISFSLNETDFSKGETDIARISIPLAVFEGQEGKYCLTLLTTASTVLSWPKVHWEFLTFAPQYRNGAVEIAEWKMN